MVGNITNSSILQVSDDCSKFRVDSKIFAKLNGSFQLTNSSIASLVALDQTFIYALGDNSIWKYSSTSNSYQNYSISLNSTFAAGTVLQSYNGSLVAYQTAAASAKFAAFIEQGSSVKLLSVTEISGYKSTPNIAISPQLSFIIVYGSSSSDAALIKLYSIDYTGQTVKAL